MVAPYACVEEEIKVPRDKYRKLFSGHLYLEDVLDHGIAGLEDLLVLIWSGEYRMFWGKNGSGYVQLPENAWQYSLADAFERTKHCGPEKQIVFCRS